MKIDRWHALKVKLREMLACSICCVARGVCERQHQHRHFNGLMDPLCIHDTFMRSHIASEPNLSLTLLWRNPHFSRITNSLRFKSRIRVFFFIIEIVDSLAARHITQNPKAPTENCTVIYNIHGHFIDNALAQTVNTTHEKRWENLPSLMVFWFGFLAICVFASPRNKLNDNWWLFVFNFIFTRCFVVALNSNVSETKRKTSKITTTVDDSNHIIKVWEKICHSG